MNARLLAAPLVFLLVAVPLSEAGSGSKSGSGSRSGSSSKAGSGSKDDPMAQLADTVLEYRGKLTKGELNGDKKATMGGFFRLQDGQVFAAAVPAGAKSGSDTKSGSDKKKEGSDRRAASIGQPRLTLVANAAGSQAIGEYRVGRKGRLTLVFGSEMKDGSDKKKEGSDKKEEGSDKKEEGSGKKDGSDKKSATSATDSSAAEAVAEADAPSSPLNGVMVLTHKKRKAGDYWIGKYREKEGKKTVRTWEVRVKVADDPARSA